MNEFDHLQRFLFEDIGIRGALVRLDSSWLSIQANHAYPSVVRSQLGQALAAATLLSATIKFKGSLILQTQSPGPLSTLVAQATHERIIRGLAHWNGELSGNTLREIYGDGNLALTILNEGSEPYQGIVALEGNNLAEALQTYFQLSEQLATRLWLTANEERAAGLLIQELPSNRKNPHDWDRVTCLADTLTHSELASLPAGDLLYRLFNEEKVRIFEAEPILFKCGCSKERIEGLILNLGQAQAASILNEREVIEIDCEFCNRHYRFDRVDVGALFEGAIKLPPILSKQ
ncbi:Hsp33 family molecular chaperone HslO [Methylomagnum sp.]